METFQKKGEGAKQRGTDALSLYINQHHKNPAGSRCRSSLEQCVWRAETPLDVIHALGPSGYTSQMGLIAQRESRLPTDSSGPSKAF